MPSKNGRPGFSHRGVSVTWSDKRKRYEGKVTVGKLADGKTLDRRNVYGKTSGETKKEIEKLQAQADAKRVPKAGRRPTVEEFTLRWLGEIAPVSEHPLRPSTEDSYRSLCKIWIFPAIGHIRVDELTVEDLDRLYATMRRAKKAPSTILKAHACIRRMLSVAMVRDLVGRNVAAERDNPGSAKGRKRKPLTLAEAKRVVAEMERSANSLRWKVALAIGPRQGEALGLRWPYLDFKRGMVDVAWQLQRITYRHGCPDPAACAGVHCRIALCPPTWAHGCGDAGGCFKQAWRCPDRAPARRCRLHKRECPPLCPPGCTGHAARCETPARGGLQFVRPKALDAAEGDETASEWVALPPTLMRELRVEKRRQDARRKAIGDEWQEHELVFCQWNGRPIDPRADYEELVGILARAKVPVSGTHLARHTAATLLYALGIDVVMIQRVLRQRDIRVTRNYVGIGEDLTKDAAAAMERALFAVDEDPPIVRRVTRSRAVGKRRVLRSVLR